MSESIHYQFLRATLWRLRRALLPRSLKLDVTQISDDVSIKALSFRILAHAEFEEYLEERVQEIAADAYDLWKQRQKASSVLLHMLAFSGVTVELPPETLLPPVPGQGGWNDKIRIKGRLKKAANVHRSYALRTNNGIKEKDILRVLIPIGFDVGKLDPIVLTDFDNFGEARGAAVHKSTAGHIRAAIDPFDEFQRVNRVLKHLSVFDAEFNRLKSSIV